MGRWEGSKPSASPDVRTVTLQDLRPSGVLGSLQPCGWVWGSPLCPRAASLSIRGLDEVQLRSELPRIREVGEPLQAGPAGDRHL